jgi:hypothetical protein
MQKRRLLLLLGLRRILGLRVVFRPEGLILQGRTDTYHVKQLAQHAAMTTIDIPILANEIEVNYSSF